MAKEILLYGAINSESASLFIKAMNNLDGKEEVTLRINSNGGNPNDMVGMIEKFQSYTGSKKIKIDGKAISSAFYFLLFTASKNIEATDVSNSMVHRASFPPEIEKDKTKMTPEMVGFLSKTNDGLRAALEAKVSPELFKKVTSKTIDQVFSTEGILNVWLTAQNLKDLGLIDKVNVITPAKMQAIEASFYDIAANYNGVQVQEVEPTQASNQANQGINLNTKNRKMTADQLKAEHPDIYASVHASGVNQERERVKAILVYHSVDAQKSVELVNAGSELTPSEREAFNLKAIQAREVTSIESASATVVVTAPVVATSDKELELEAFEKNIFAKLKLKGE